MPPDKGASCSFLMGNIPLLFAKLGRSTREEYFGAAQVEFNLLIIHTRRLSSQLFFREKRQI